MESNLLPPFARLVPCNQAAIQAASDVFEKATQDKTKFRCQLANLVSGRERVKLRTLLQVPRSSSSQESISAASSTGSTIPDDENDPLSEMVWPVHYVFSIDHHPQQPRLGWTVGYGHGWSEESPCGKVDILIGLDAQSRPEIELKSKHAFFNFALPSGQFAVRQARHDALISLGGLPISQRFHMLLKEEVVCFSQLQYRFIYDVAPEIEIDLRNRKASYFANQLHAPLPNRLTSATPSVNDVRFNNWTILSTAGAGSQSIVRSAVSTTGETAAVIRGDCNRRNNRRGAAITLDLLYLIRSRLRERNHEGRSFITMLHSTFESNAQEIFILLVPLGLCDFELLLRSPNTECEEALFCQVIAGLAALHDAGFVHTDIKPANLVIRSFEPPRAVIIDLMGAIDIIPHPDGIMGRLKRGGTAGYLAPEREASIFSMYGTPADIWSLGTVGLQILVDRNCYAPFSERQYVNPFRNFDFGELFDKRVRWNRIKNDPERIQRGKAVTHLASFRAYIDLHGDPGLFTLISSMLSFSPEDRPTAEEALRDPRVRERLC